MPEPSIAPPANELAVGERSLDDYLAEKRRERKRLVQRAELWGVNAVAAVERYRAEKERRLAMQQEQANE